MNNIAVNFILTISLTSFSFLSHAQEKKNITLQEAIDLGVKNSKNLVIANARINEAVAISRQAYDKRLPDLNITGSYIRLSGANIDLKKSNSNTAPGETPKVSQALYGIANLSLPLYAGGRIRYGIESSKLLEKATRMDAENDRDNVEYNLASAYINLYKAKQAIYVVKENLEVSRARDSNFLRLENNGLLARNDLLKASLQTSNTELALLDAENDATLANMSLDLLLGLPGNTELIPDTSFMMTIPATKTFAEYEMLALQNRKDISANASRVKAYTYIIKSAKAEGYPTIALTGGYIAARIPGIITITNAINAGIGIQYNLASLWKSNYRLAEVRAKEQENIAMGELLNDDVRRTINKDYLDYQLSLKKAEVFERSFEQATENYRITNNKYINNLVSITDLLDANQSLLQAKLNRQLSKADIVLAEKKILLTAGIISK